MSQSIDLTAMTLSELQALQKQVARQIETYEAQRVQKALAAATEAAKEHGFALKELLDAAATGKRTVAAKYADPDDPSRTWTGRGRKPAWVQARLEKGASLDDLAI
ncbi:H-NS family nucleoid-associated regulatory protein [Paracoccus sulfuroxidans]|uniref:Nucleoid protein H-NS n=1 Tax=Paracoccus sulfuroxidans TaxID=384678 RepID=A0A562N810_9RHOB|nr:H-NS histone family protein [Paracoccus sulfuroxidans]TWI28218.1 nucleoid protein H-NS [Paracoccus sulfuroxidans]